MTGAVTVTHGHCDAGQLPLTVRLPPGHSVKVTSRHAAMPRAGHRDRADIAVTVLRPRTMLRPPANLRLAKPALSPGRRARVTRPARPGAQQRAAATVGRDWGQAGPMH